jgi:hypothetical protein
MISFMKTMLKGLLVVAFMSVLVAIPMISVALCDGRLLIGLLIGFSPEILIIIYLLGELFECHEINIGDLRPTKK